MFYSLKINLLLFLLLLLVPFFGYCQTPQGAIFASIQLKDGKTLKGQIIWDNEQGLWEDIFYAVRAKSPVYYFLGKKKPKDLKKKSKDLDLGFMQLWEDKIPDSSPSFSSSFGDIAYLKPVGNNKVLLGLKDGKTVELDMSKNGDLDDRIFLYDKSRKRHTLYLKNIKKITFQSFDPAYRLIRGKPMYGSFLTSIGSYSGYVSWDDEESFQYDNIQGRRKDKKVDLKFKDIYEIKAQDDGALITLVNGKRMFLNNHDDVDDGNHGIMIMGLDFGAIELEWEHLISARFMPSPTKPKGFKAFKKTGVLKGVVTTNNGKKYKGQLVYNLNQMYRVEVLTGENNNYEYDIPFYRIAQIAPQNDKYALVLLKNGTQLLLGDDDNVTEENEGVIVRTRQGKTDYIAWENIKTIAFE
ncbi:MAG: hypothetical protein COA50_06885 [Flavobacteriaceae bacterium]|nr:MAG: hypothetical protein COA50_06885 [Flavobacteriaceae bacterium]